MKRGVFIALIGGLFLMGCSIPFIGSKPTQPPSTQEIQRPPVEKIVISELDIVDRPYKMVGEVHAIEKSFIPFKSPSKANAMMKLREEALKINADAIIFVSFTLQETSWTGTQSMEARGKAVKFTRY